jgi:hypothetical protein
MIFLKEISVKTCSSHKKMYPTESIAEEALIAARTAYDYRDKNGPVGIYHCDICASYHMTSKGPMNQRLAESIASGALKKDVEANIWLDKLKRKRP